MKPTWQNILLRKTSHDVLVDSVDSTQGLARIASLIIQAEWATAESALLSSVDFTEKARLSLLAFLDLRIRNFSRLNRLIPYLVQRFPQDPFVRSLWVNWNLISGNESDLLKLPDSFWAKETSCLHLCLSHGYWLLKKTAFQECEFLIETVLSQESLDRDLLISQLFQRKREPHKALEKLMPWCNYAFGRPDFWRTFLQLHFELRKGDHLATFLRQGLGEVPRKEEILDLFAWGCVLQRKPAEARRNLFVQRLLGWNLFEPTAVAHLFTCYENLGETENVQYMHSSISSEPTKFLDVFASLILHLTSIEHQSISSTSKTLIDVLERNPGYKKHLPVKPLTPASKKKNDRLRIAWVTGDCRYHPVSRFLLGFLNSLSGNFSHDHLLVSTTPFDDQFPEFFQKIDDLQVIDFSGNMAHHMTNAIRDLSPDIAIDLSGWTHSNIAASFMARVAPIQVNYLGYFGSTGIPAMDWWLGDSNLFPSKMSQWHSEKIYRLSRCFLAWDPHPELPEANIDVQESPQGPVRFGCFNHLRKLSDFTLRTWASILEKVPNSRLVLKAAGLEDMEAIALLKRRLMRAGFDLERIDFLSFASSVSEHLSQYRFLDIALDPFPNGGCTTTAEALWMGVPVITMKGKSYVSRMSTAVLKGVNMDSWIANDYSSYEDLAVLHSSNLSTLRQTRENWRLKLKKSELGDSKGLMRELEEAFSVMSSPT